MTPPRLHGLSRRLIALRPLALPGALLRRLLHWRAEAAQLRALTRLEAAHLDDIGLGPDEVERLIRRRDWDPPRHWLG